ncbi:hypothetical protein PMI38_04841 [Pseudomonas sp. GM84]|uniref:phage protein NinX family protein n=1 Tax=Pseudomonas sp. GM84 TaxID=1144340 RepID=UPI00026FD069|nr:phage protein NinX family protein [Pseudomonas sp. GM84]EJN33286.1 hypothetical protein PMI38_04841 [Pseudomonas sp. GM84]
MTDLIEVRTAHLAGEPLAWAVGRAESLDVLLAPPIYGNPWRVFVRYTGEVTIREVRYDPQENWAVGGPLIDKYQAGLSHDRYLSGGPCGCSAGPINSTWLSGPTPLIAFCRALVHAKLGPIVRVPKELMP